MILLINVLLTEEQLNNDVSLYRRGFLDSLHKDFTYDKVDIFKYTLASYTVIPWSKVLIYCELDTVYKEREQEIQDFVKEEFKNYNVHLSFKRNEYQKDWQKIYDEHLDEDLIWFCCNHDHPFMDYNLDILDKGIDLLSQCPDFPASIYFSHWPELLNKSTFLHNEKPGPVDIHDGYIGFQLINNNDSIQIINKALYRRWWFEENYGNAFLPRSDYRLYKNNKPVGYDIRENRKHALYHYCFVPLRELCRHYDGYGHVNIDSHKCPALVIPPYFFSNSMQIRWNYPDYYENWVNINPTKENYSAVDRNGTDYKWVPEDIPLFWLGRIQTEMYNVVNNIDDKLFYDCRNQAVKKIAGSSMNLFERNLEEQAWYDQWKIHTEK